MVIRRCVKCEIEKEITKFRKLKKWFRHICKECYAAQYRTGKPNKGRFQKGHKSIYGFKKGQIGYWNGKKRTSEQIEKTASKLRGRKQKPEHIEKRRLARLSSPKVFRDGKSRRSRKSVEWSLAIRNRDGNKCTKCLSTERLHAHHIIPWRVNEELRYELFNGITLCNSCHKKEEPFDNYWKGKKFSEEHRRKLSEAKKGKYVPWNKGKNTTS